MNIASRLRQFVLAAYGCALRVYPAEFRKRYADEMLRCGRDMLTDSPSALNAARLLATDLFRSLLTEHLAMTPYSKAVPQLASSISVSSGEYALNRPGVDLVPDRLWQNTH